MPMNAPPEFNRAMEKYSSARTLRDKVRYLEEALRWLPKHKGTENMRKQLMKRLAELRRELLKEKRKKRGGGKSVLVPKSGYQAAVWGYTNSGKSHVLSILSGTELRSTPVPLETNVPTPVMVEVGGGKVQLVELPSYFDGFESSKLAPLVFTSIRAADHLVLVVDLTWDPRQQVDTLVQILRENDIFPNRDPPPVKVERQYSGGIKFVGEDLFAGEKEEFIEILQMFGLHNATVVAYGRITPEDLFLALDEGAKFIPAVLLGNKNGFEEEFLKIEGFPKVLFRGRETAEELFRAMGLIRVFTKPHRGEVSREAVVMREGSTPLDLAEVVLGRREVKEVRLWREGSYINVSKEYRLRDGYIIELR